jgi:hypothetical protein
LFKKKIALRNCYQTKNVSEKLSDVKFGENQNNSFRQKKTKSESVSPEQRRMFFHKNK